MTNQNVAKPVRRHLVDRDPVNADDTSRALCVRGGTGKRVPAGRTPYRHGWTLDRAKVTCPKCLEWMHA